MWGKTGPKIKSKEMYIKQEGENRIERSEAVTGLKFKEEENAMMTTNNES